MRDIIKETIEILNEILPIELCYMIVYKYGGFPKHPVAQLIKDYYATYDPDLIRTWKDFFGCSKGVLRNLKVKSLQYPDHHGFTDWGNYWVDRCLKYGLEKDCYRCGTTTELTVENLQGGYLFKTNNNFLCTHCYHDPIGETRGWLE